MTGTSMKRASLADLRRMNDAGALTKDPSAPAGDDLGPDFWAGAVVEQPARLRSVHLKIDQDVFDFFRDEAGGKGHITRMQNVLKAYAKARRAAGPR